MAITQDELDSFHRFASDKVSNGGSDMTWAELFQLWRFHNPTPSEQADVNQAIRAGIAEADAGLGRSADDFVDDMRQKHNIPPDA